GPLACGSAGAACVTCNVGQQCVSGACVTGMCSPTTCGGCCTNNFCVTAAGQNAFACGSGGAACVGCGGGQSCINGACVATPPCGPTNCATGCCAQNQCVTVQSRFACGLAGAMCQQCPMQNFCSAGVCTPAPLDAGIGGDAGTVLVGSPCTSVQSCRPPQNAICIQESQFGQPTGYPGGYCTAQCGASNPCSGGECVTELVFGTSQSSCRASCAAPGTGQSTCRAGYVCVGTTPPGYCRPACGNGGLAACGTGQQCGDAGYCN
ncbi:MAG: family peptidase, partial [Myxococcaceae bacterium]|nr:family peptidase [Myxococcaceae bacterium]